MVVMVMAMLMVMITMILTEIGGDEFYRMENASLVSSVRYVRCFPILCYQFISVQ